jgi:hypothetical protein
VGDDTGDVATNPAPMKHRRERSLTALVVLEAVIGQLYPATLLARLITLELETRRRPQG